MYGSLDASHGERGCASVDDVTWTELLAFVMLLLELMNFKNHNKKR